jgi:hypothetical protein
MTTDYPHDEVEGIEENIVFEGDTGNLPLDARKGLAPAPSARTSTSRPGLRPG